MELESNPSRCSFFTRFATATARFSGRPVTFIVAVLIIAVWGLTGPIFHYSNTWQLIINTGTTIITFLMVFLIQNTQNRDSEALHLKIDELIRATAAADNALLDVEELEERELDQMRAEYGALAKQAMTRPRQHRIRQVTKGPDATHPPTV